MQTLASVAVGSLVKLNESGSPVEFYVAKHDYESGLNGAGRTLLVRKDLYDKRVWDNGNVNAWANCDLRAWLNSTYKTILDSDVQEAIGTTTYHYTRGNGNNTVTTRSDAVFILSVTELGESYTYANVEGSALPIASTLQIAYHNGSATIQWTRSPLTNRTSHVWVLDANGNISGNGLNVSCGSRPAFTLSSTTYVTDDGTIIFNEPPTAPGSISLGTVTAGQSCEITWTAATDTDGTIASYTLERSVNGSSWTQVFSGNALTYTDTIGQGWATVAYRVCAVDNYGASGPYATSETSVVNAGVLYISGPATPMGEKTAPFAFTISTGVSGQSAVTDIAVEISMDGNQLYSGTVDTGEEVSVTIDPRVIGGGSHTVEVSAGKESYVAASQSYTFTTPSLSLPAGGLGTQLQDNQGRPIFPQSVAALIGGLYGQSVAANLQQLVKGVLYNKTQIPKYQEVTVDLSTAQEGDIIQLPEGGQMVDYIVVNVGNPNSGIYDESCNGVWLLRKDIAVEQAWDNGNVNDYANSTINAYLNGAWLDRYPQGLQSGIVSAKIPYRAGSGASMTVTNGANGLSVKAFLLSATELNLSTGFQPVNEGATLAYFSGTSQDGADTKRVARLNGGSAKIWWTRSPWCQSAIGATNVLNITSNGSYNSGGCNSAFGVRPCIIMSSTFSAIYYVDITGTVHASQEYTEGGTFNDFFGNEIPVPRVETGSYVGTGVMGQENPVTLTFGFKPKMVIVSSVSSQTSGSGYYYGVIPWFYGQPTAPSILEQGSNNLMVFYSVVLSWGENSVSWYTMTNLQTALNLAGTTYQYIAIG